MTPASSTADEFGFDVPLDRAGLSTAKWEMEIARTQDPTLLCFGTAEMDYRAAPPIRAALERVAGAGHFGYPFKRASYYEAVVGYFDRHFGWKIEKDWIASNVGIYPSMQPLIEELTEPGDEILYQPPVHHIFPEVIQAAGRVALANPLVERRGRYEIDFDDLSWKVTERTRMLLLCSPHNPVGRVWTRAELDRLSAFCLERGILVLSDEVYCGLIFDGVAFTPFANVSAAASRNSVTLTSASKSFNVTGLKHSLVIAEDEGLRGAYMRGLKRNNLYFGGCVFGQAAAEAAFRDCDAWTKAAVRHIEGNFRYLEQFLRIHLPELSVTSPEGTYFAWINVKSLDLATEQLRDVLEKEAHVAVTYGAFLGEGGDGHIRLNLATARSNLSEGLCRIAAAIRTHIPHSNQPGS
ncbi:aminotransferase class I/II-fold pyridoxal phosphate-dependent enzyme [Methylobacterium sp. NEAU 140]|uniref:MalY/PatB family protein n=1 Tax=Methylobacterium sp. NEAU 140 TaxID=3064945 RepID=UPI002734DB8F|nr:aminotransferase class I/II-fold pyridoxal phosphate-dependent enzyme [Methylobacterium sp. NEAU 140]MDP4021986.1 aminotransferase class I/II-fold pyridoxal phosphate-dependent enzyme [Methylobacterium sp. NEAU 140]